MSFFNAQNSNKYADKTILDSLQYIVYLPDENYYPFGDNISERIIKKGEIIVPELIEKITDVTKTKIKIADAYDYTVSDVSITLIQYIYMYKYERNLPFRDILISEFYNNIDTGDFTYSLYYKTFFTNNEKNNYNNRLQFYKRIKNWYEENKKIENL
jgi:hypothetical protein